jgi:hypothetical protein
MQRNCHLFGSCLPARNRVAIWYANSQVVGRGRHHRAGIGYFGLMCRRAYDLSCGRIPRLLGLLPGPAQHLGFVPGQGRPHLRLARV